MKALEKLENQLPSVFKKRGTAVLVLVLLVLLSVFGIGGVKLRSAQKPLEKVFAERLEPELEARAAAAHNLLTLAENLSAKENFPGMTEMQTALKNREKSKEPAERCLADLEIEKAVNQLGDALQEPAQQAGKQELLNRQLAEFESKGRVVSHELKDYNQQAEEFNQKLNAFPASLIGLVGGVREVDLCE